MARKPRLSQAEIKAMCSIKSNGNGTKKKRKKAKKRKKSPPVSQQCDPSGLKLIKVGEYKRRPPGGRRKSVVVDKHVRNCPGAIPF